MIGFVGPPPLVTHEKAAHWGGSRTHVTEIAKSGGLLPPSSPPAEKTTACCDETGHTGTGNGAGNGVAGHRIEPKETTVRCCDGRRCFQRRIGVCRVYGVNISSWKTATVENAVDS